MKKAVVPICVILFIMFVGCYLIIMEYAREKAADRAAEMTVSENVYPEALTDDDRVAGVYAAYWKWLLEYDMTGLAAEITAPCLVLQGEEDYQATMEDFNILRDALDGKENWTFKSYPGLTHVFMEGKKADGPAAYMGEKHVSGEVIADIADFILEK